MINLPSTADDSIDKGNAREELGQAFSFEQVEEGFTKMR